MRLRIITLLVIIAVTVSFSSYGQTIFTEDFNGATHTFTLNSVRTIGGNTSLPTSDKSNHFAVDDIYEGGCGYGLGSFCIRTIPNTPDEDAQISGAPKSKYLHLVGDDYATQTPPAFNACINPAGDDRIQPRDRELYYFAEMTNDISTTGKTGVQLTFWWLNKGSNENYARLYYSTDGGSTWTLAKDNMYGKSTWNKETYPSTTGVFDNLPQLRIGFWFVSVSKYNTVNPGALQPSLAIDDIIITGTGGSTNPTITTGVISGSPFCPGTSVSVPFTTTGNFNSGNAFDVYLSDASGNFPGTKIGNGLASPISAMIPGGAAAGTGYRIRVVATNPSTTGTANTSDLTITATGSAGTISAVKDTICENTPAVLNVSGASGNIQWQSSNSPSGTFTDISGATDAAYVSVPTQTTYYKVKAGSGACSATSPVAFEVVVMQSPTAGFTFTISGKTVNFTNTSTGATSFLWRFDDGNTSSETNPSHTYANTDLRHVCLDATNGSNCSFTTCVDILFTGIKDISKQSQWEVFPDPVTDNLFIRTKSGNLTVESIEIFDLLGKSAIAETFEHKQVNTIQMNVSTLAKGMYFLKVKTADAISVQPIIKQ